MKNLNVDYYDKYYVSEESSEMKLKQATYLISKLPSSFFKRKSKVLDVGSGDGVWGSIIKKKYKSEVHGIDLSKEGVRQSINLGVKAKVWNIEKKWPYGNCYFNLITGVQLIEHLVNPDYFFSETQRVLKPGGLLILTTPNLAAWFNRLIFLLGYQPFFLEVSTRDKTVGLGFTRNITQNRKPLGHIRVFTLKALKDMLALYDFEIVKTVGGSVFYLPKLMAHFDGFFSNFPSLATDLIVVARKK